MTGPHAYIRDVNGNFTLFSVPGALFTEEVNVDESGVVYGNAFTSMTTVQIFRRDTNGNITLLPPILGAADNEVAIATPRARWWARPTIKVLFCRRADRR